MTARFQVSGGFVRRGVDEVFAVDADLDKRFARHVFRHEQGIIVGSRSNPAVIIACQFPFREGGFCVAGNLYSRSFQVIFRDAIASLNSSPLPFGARTLTTQSFGSFVPVP